MSETANCPHCNQKYDITPEYIGTAFKCVDCGKTFVFVDKPQVNQATSMTKNCSFCGEKVLRVAKKCKHCGEFFDPADKPTRRVNRQTYIWLAILFGNLGVHNFYAKQNGRGAWHLLVQILACIAAANSRADDSFGVFAVISGLNMVCAVVDCFIKPEEKKDAISIAFCYIVGFCFVFLIDVAFIFVTKMLK